MIPDDVKLGLIEEVFMQQRVRGGADIKALPAYKQIAMLDVIGRYLFTEEWELNNEEIEQK